MLNHSFYPRCYQPKKSTYTVYFLVVSIIRRSTMAHFKFGNGGTMYVTSRCQSVPAEVIPIAIITWKDYIKDALRTYYYARTFD
jgi:hypothetical protein